MALRTGSSTHALVEQVCSRSNMLHHVRPARRGLEPLITFCLARAQTVAIYAALYYLLAHPLRWALAAGDHSARRQDFQVVAETLNTTARDRYQGARRA